MDLEKEVDVVVVGFGCAGACAAIEATKNGAQVMVIERFNGGGATAMSGGIVYLGGGTKYQKQAGFTDSPDNMFCYLKQEVQGVVSEKTLRSFCEQSCDNLSWLEDQGVRFDSNFCPVKTSYPVNKYFLYYSGNETFPPYNQTSQPAPRGHRVKGKGMAGNNLYKALKKSALEAGVQVLYQTRAVRFIVEKNRVTAIEISSLRVKSMWFFLHKLVAYTTYKLRYLTLTFPPLNRLFEKLFSKLELKGQSRQIRVRQGVILATGGFIYNHFMIKQYAPNYTAGVPLGTHGDNGSAISMAMAIGGDIGQMTKVSAWRFINPPRAFVEGILVDRQGQRICNEQLYGAQIGEKICENHNQEAFLIIDSTIWKQAHSDILPGKATWFQSMPALINLYLNIKKAKTIDTLALRCGISVDGLNSTINSYNKLAINREKDPMGKSNEYFRPLQGPFYAIDCSLANKLFACATLTLGGLVVDEETGEVKRKDGEVISGLYAIGRSAVGICSNGYVSGLSLADCIFSGRRAGKHIANI